MMEKNLYPEIPKEKFKFVQKDERIHDEKLQTKSVSYLGDAWLRFRKNKSSVVAFCLIVFLLLFAIITPFVSPYTVQFCLTTAYSSPLSAKAVKPKHEKSVISARKTANDFFNAIFIVASYKKY